MPALSLHSISPTVRTWAHVDLEAVGHNVRVILRLLKRGAALMAVVKANAYGHGGKAVARAALAHGAQALGVASVAEGIELREAGIAAPILLLGPCIPEELLPGIERGLTFAVSREDEISALAERTRAFHQGPQRRRRTPVHLLVDTGMGRGGFAPEEIWPVAERIKAERTLELEGIFTHFTSADESDPEPTREQVTVFRELLRRLEERGVSFRVRHAANSAATVFFPESQLSLVRCGALLHGLRAWPAHRDTLDLRPTLSLHTRIVHLGRRPAGWPVGYNRTHLCARESILATLPAGYRDGYRRALSGKSEVLVHGQRMPVVGAISMDYTVVDVTALAQTPLGLPQIGEEVTLIGGDPGGERISVEELAAASGTIPYVVTTQLGSNVQRNYRGHPAWIKDPASAPAHSPSGEPEDEAGIRPELRRLPPPKIVPYERPPRRDEEDETPSRMAAGA